MAKTVINVGTAANDGTGDQLRTAFISTNSNFDEIYGGTATVVRQTAATDLKGVSGDLAGMITTDGTDVWLCITDWVDGVADIWFKLPNSTEIVETNDLTAAVTWDDVPDANVTETSVTQHQAAVLEKTITTDSTTDHPLVLADAATVIRMTNGAANTVTIPDNAVIAFPVGTQIEVIQAGGGTTSVAITTDSVNGGAGPIALAGGQYAVAKLTKVTATEWVVSGDI
jgi:hypothetical protein